MKNLKKLVALLMAVAMLSALCVSASAEGKTFTINAGSTSSDVEDTIQYTWYRIFNADVRSHGTVNDSTGELSDTGIVAYYIPAGNTTLAEAVDALTVGSDDMFDVYLTADGKDYAVTLKSKTSGNFTAEEIAAALDGVKDKAIANGTFNRSAPGGSASASNLPDGYYLVVSSLGTKLAVQTTGDITIKEKNEYPSITKTENVSTASIGQLVTYTVAVKIPNSAAQKTITIVDSISQGLTMNSGISVEGVSGTYAPVFGNRPDFTDGSKTYTVYTIEIDPATVNINKGKTLTFTYNATLNNNAIVKGNETNKAHVEYDHFVSQDVSVNVTTYGFSLEKIDGSTSDPLDGAQFSLWDAETNGNQIYLSTPVAPNTTTYRVDLTGFGSSAVIQAGTATIEGLAEGEYYLQEDVAPTGYNRLATRQKISVTASSSDAGVDIAVENNAGVELPSTGGIGTTIFYVVGIALALGAAVILVARRKADSEK